MTAIRKLHFSLSISAHEYQAYYRGIAHDVSVVTQEGLRISFPASELRRYVFHEGIQGDFVIKFDENNKLVALQKV